MRREVRRVERLAGGRAQQVLEAEPRPLAVHLHAQPAHCYGAFRVQTLTARLRSPSTQVGDLIKVGLYR